MKKWAESDEDLAKAIETEPTNEEYQQARNRLRADSRVPFTIVNRVDDALSAQPPPGDQKYPPGRSVRHKTRL